MGNYKFLVVEAYSEEEALAKTNFKEIVHNCTIVWKQNVNEYESDEFIQFAKEQIYKWTNNVPGKACVITLDNGVKNTREFPCKINDIINQKGKRNYGKYIMITDESNKIVLISNESKIDVKRKIRNMYADGLITGKIKGTYIRMVDVGEPLAFTAEYSPSKNTKLGTYLIFGIL